MSNPSKQVLGTAASRVAGRLASAKTICDNWRSQGLKVVFTNGCFDLLHVGHVTYLAEAKALGDRLVVGLNSDRSVKRLKGKHRPVQAQSDRATILASLRAVDLVVIFEDDTPLELVTTLNPDVLVKGGDYQLSSIVGAQEVMNNGGEVKVLTFVDGKSTSSLITSLNSKK